MLFDFEKLKTFIIKDNNKILKCVYFDLQVMLFVYGLINKLIAGPLLKPPESGTFFERKYNGQMQNLWICYFTSENL